MHILVVSQYFWPENFRINDLVQEWTRRGHAVTVLTGKPNYPSGRVFPEFEQDPSGFVEFHGARIVRVPMLARAQGSVRLLLNYISYVISASALGPWHLRGRAFDVVFVFEPSPVTVGIPAIVMGKLKRAPVVFWVLDLWPETLSAIGVVRSRRVLGWVGRLVSFIYNRCTLILGQSRGFQASISQYCHDVRKIRYFPSWSEDVFAQSDAGPAPEITSTMDVFNVLFAGNIGEAQDLPAVLDAASLLKDNPGIRWLIVGDGRKSEWLKSEVSRRGLVEQVQLLGRHPVERMPSFYYHAQALLVSLKKDPVFSLTIPGKVQSYLMSGIPILGMLDGEGAEVIQRAQAGLVCGAGDARGLADAVLKLAALDPSARHALGDNGRRFAKQEFDRETLMDKLEQWMKESVDIQRQQGREP